MGPVNPAGTFNSVPQCHKVYHTLNKETFSLCKLVKINWWTVTDQQKIRNIRNLKCTKQIFQN